RGGDLRVELGAGPGCGLVDAGVAAERAPRVDGALERADGRVKGDVLAVDAGGRLMQKRLDDVPHAVARLLCAEGGNVGHAGPPSWLVFSSWTVEARAADGALVCAPSSAVCGAGYAVAGCSSSATLLAGRAPASASR